MAAVEQGFNLEQVWGAVRRRLLPALLLFGLVLTGATLFAVFWPPSYSSTGTILIEQQELPSDLVRSTVSTYATQRIQVITQRVMTTENLMGIIRRYNLYPQLRQKRPREEIIAKMRHDTNLQMISADVIDPRDGRPMKATIAFSLTYSNVSPQLAARVANELVSLYLQQNIETRQKSSRDAAVFLADESNQLSGEIKAAQDKLALFKGEHANELPELNQYNLQALNHAEDELRSVDMQSHLIDQQLVYLEAQLAQINPASDIYTSTGQRVQSPADMLKALRSEYTRASALYGPDYPDVIRLKREIGGLEENGKQVQAVAANNDDRRALKDAQTKLADAQQRYSPDYPDVIRLQKLVQSLQQKLPSTTAADSETASAKTDAGSDAQRDAPGAVAPDNPVYIQLWTQRQAALNQRKALEDQRAALQTKHAAYERRLAQAPSVERDYTDLVRDLNSAQAQYAEIRRKQREADIAENLEEERKGERFTLIEPPFASEDPTSPNRRLIMIFGAVFAVAAGLGMVLLLETMDGTVRSPQDLRSLLSTAPLAIIPVMHTLADRHRMRWRRRAAYGGVAAATMIAVAMVHFMYRPLDVMWVAALRHLGIQS